MGILQELDQISSARDFGTKSEEFAGQECRKTKQINAGSYFPLNYDQKASSEVQGLLGKVSW